MSTRISYQGVNLGTIRTNPYTKKWEFYAENLGALETLLNLPKWNGKVNVNDTTIPIKEFREEYLSKIFTFFPSIDAGLLQYATAKTTDELSTALKERKVRVGTAPIQIVEEN